MSDITGRNTPSAAPFEEYAIPSDAPGDFAVYVMRGEWEPWLHDGDILLVERRIDLADGDVGLFHIRGTLCWRQYCRDSFGNIHLLTLDRSRRSEDILLPASAALDVTCYGRALLREPIPLPMD